MSALKISTLACMLLLSISLSAQTNQSKKVALVIGAKNYQHVAPLQNSLNDAKDMAATLKGKGFEVVELYDPQTKRQIQDGVIKYFQILQADKNSVGMVYYSGHGMQVDGANYLIPTQANPQIKADLDDQCLNMDYIMRAIEQAGNELNIFVLDACRNNPFRGFYRSSEQGLSMVTTPKGSYIVYATKPGSVASDGTGRNGLFTSKLLKYLNTEGLNIEQVFKRVAADVSKESNDAQRPWIASDYTGDFFFTPGTGTAKEPVKNNPVVTEKRVEEKPVYTQPQTKTEDTQYQTQNYNNSNTSSARFINPLASSVQRQWVKRDDYTMSMTMGDGVQQMSLGNVRVSIRPSNNKLIITQQLNISSYGVNSIWTDSSVADLQSLTPLYYAANNDFRDTRLTYSRNSVTGYYYDKLTFARTPISDQVDEGYFDFSESNYIIPWLPLAEGYQTTIPVYAINTVMDRGIKTISIIGTTILPYQTITGQTINCFEVDVVDNNTQSTSIYYIGVNDRKIYEVSTSTQNGMMRLVRTN